MRGGIGSLLRYDSFEQIGEGTYGHVFKARDKQIRSQIVALKRLIFHRDSTGFPLSAVREIKLLQTIKHPNIVELLNIVSSKGCEDAEGKIKTETLCRTKAGPVAEQPRIPAADDMDISRCGNIYLVFEYIQHDLSGLVDVQYPFQPDQIRILMKQLFEVLDYLHIEKRIMHRDIKTSNLLVSSDLRLKLADFGLARHATCPYTSLESSGLFGPALPAADITRPALTNNNCDDKRVFGVECDEVLRSVVTMWYRPPELLLGETRYTYVVDLWSAGCVMGELLLGRPMFPGKSEASQFDLICRAIGSPSETSWPGVTKLSNYSALMGPGTDRVASSLKLVYQNRIPDATLMLVERLLVADPAKRLDAKMALNNRYFLSCPDRSAIPHLDLGSRSSFHEFETKKRRRGELDTVTARGLVTSAAGSTNTSAPSSYPIQSTVAAAPADQTRAPPAFIEGVGVNKFTGERPSFDQVPKKAVGGYNMGASNDTVRDSGDSQTYTTSSAYAVALQGGSAHDDRVSMRSNDDNNSKLSS